MDSAELFGRYVASELRALDSQSQRWVKLQIQNTLFTATQPNKCMPFSHPTMSPSTRPTLVGLNPVHLCIRPALEEMQASPQLLMRSFIRMLYKPVIDCINYQLSTYTNCIKMVIDCMYTFTFMYRVCNSSMIARHVSGTIRPIVWGGILYKYCRL